MFKKIGGFFSKLFGSVPSWTVKASAAISYAAPLINGILALTTGPEYSTEVANIIGEVKSDLALSSALVASAHGSGVAPAGLESALQAVNDNMNALLTAGHIKNPATLAKVKAIADLVTGETTAILESLPKQQNSGGPAGFTPAPGLTGGAQTIPNGVVTTPTISTSGTVTAAPPDAVLSNAG